MARKHGTWSCTTSRGDFDALATKDTAPTSHTKVSTRGLHACSMNGVYVPAINSKIPRWSASWSSQVDFFQVATIMLNVAEQNSIHTSDRAYKPNPAASGAGVATAMARGTSSAAAAKPR